MPYCENCGTKLSLTANFCFNCGNAAVHNKKNVKHSQITQDVEKGLKTWGKEGKAIAWLVNL